MTEKYPTLFHFLSAEFDKAKIPFLLVGGFAVNYYKATRATQDLDVLICDEDFKKALLILEKGGYRKNLEASLFARFDSDDPAFSDLDLIFVDRATLNGMLQEAKQGVTEGQKFKFPSLEHLIALKLHSIKNNPENREHRDLGDIIELIKRNRVDFHSGKFKELCLKYGPDKIHDKIAGALASWKS